MFVKNGYVSIQQTITRFTILWVLLIGIAGSILVFSTHTMIEQTPPAVQLADGWSDPIGG